MCVRRVKVCGGCFLSIPTHTHTHTHAGLCIELWKVTKVISIRVDRENMIAGVIPRIVFADRPSYKSSTKEYDVVSCVCVCV